MTLDLLKCHMNHFGDHLFIETWKKLQPSSSSFDDYPSDWVNQLLSAISLSLESSSTEYYDELLTISRVCGAEDWVIMQLAASCVNSRLKTPLGPPAATLKSVEQALHLGCAVLSHSVSPSNSLASSSSFPSPNVTTPTSTPSPLSTTSLLSAAMHILCPRPLCRDLSSRRLMKFVELLEKGVHLAHAGDFGVYSGTPDATAIAQLGQGGASLSLASISSSDADHQKKNMIFFRFILFIALFLSFKC